LKVNSEQLLDEIIADVKSGVYDTNPIEEEPQVAPSEAAPKQKKSSVFKKILGVFTKILIVLLVAFLVVGPKDLPKVARWIARQVRTIKKLVNEVKKETGWDEFAKELKDTRADVEKTVQEANVEKELREVSEDLTRETNAIRKDLDKAADAVNEAMKSE